MRREGKETMTGRCTFADQFAALVNRPAEDPFWHHAQECPDCRALVAAYREFLDPAEHEATFDLDAADADLAARLDQNLDRAVAPDPSPAPVALPDRRNPSRFWYALAAVLLVGVGLVYWPSGGDDAGIALPPASGVTRGDGTVLAGYEAAFQKEGLVVRWPADARADACWVVFLDKNLDEVHRAVTVADSLLILRPGILDRSTFAQVLFVAAGDTLARSPLFPIDPRSD